MFSRPGVSSRSSPELVALGARPHRSHARSSEDLFQARFMPGFLLVECQIARILSSLTRAMPKSDGEMGFCSFFGALSSRKGTYSLKIDHLCPFRLLFFVSSHVSAAAVPMESRLSMRRAKKERLTLTALWLASAKQSGPAAWAWQRQTPPARHSPRPLQGSGAPGHRGGSSQLAPLQPWPWSGVLWGSTGARTAGALAILAAGAMQPAVRVASERLLAVVARETGPRR